MNRLRSFPRNLVILAAAAALALAACGGGSSGSSTSAGSGSGQTINLLTFGVEPGLGPTLAAFQKKTGIKVVAQYVTTTDFPTVLQTRVAAKADVDIINLRSGSEFNKYATAGTFQPYTDKTVLSRVSAGGIQAGTVNGKTYGFATNLFTIGATYNPTLFAKAGIKSAPVNWDQFLADCKKLKAAGISPISWSGADGWSNQYIYHSAIGLWAQQHPSFMTDLSKGTATWSQNKLFTTQIQRWATLNKMGYLMPGGQTLHESDAAAAFNAQKAAIWIDGNWDLAELKPDGFTPRAFPVPLSATGTKPSPGSALIDNMWAITTWSKKTAAAKEFLNWFTQPANAKVYSTANDRASTIKGVTVKLSPFTAANSDWNKMTQDSVPFPFDLSTSVNGSGPNLLSQLTAGQLNAQQVISGFQSLQNTDNKAAQK